MEINKLIDSLIEQSRAADAKMDSELADLLAKAAETIRLLREIAVDASNEEFRMQFDEQNGGKK